MYYQSRLRDQGSCILLSYLAKEAVIGTSKLQQCPVLTQTLTQNIQGLTESHHTIHSVCIGSSNSGQLKRTRLKIPPFSLSLSYKNSLYPMQHTLLTYIGSLSWTYHLIKGVLLMKKKLQPSIIETTTIIDSIKSWHLMYCYNH